MDVARDVPFSGTAPVVGITAANNQAIAAPQHIRPDVGGNRRGRGVGRGIVITACQSHSRQVARSGHGVHGAEPFLHGGGADVVQGQRLLVRQRAGGGGGNVFQAPDGVPDGVVRAGARKRDDRFSVHGADGVQGGVNVRQREAGPQVHAQVVRGVHQRFGTEQVLEFLETGEINQAGSQRHVLKHGTHVVHGGVVQAASVHGDIARNRPRAVGENAHRFPHHDGVLEIHGPCGGGDSSVPRQPSHVHGSGARIQPAPRKDGINVAGLGKHGAGVDGVGSRKRHVLGKVYPA